MGVTPGPLPPATLLMQRIKLLAPTRVSNGAGGWTTTYAEAAEVNGQVYEVSSARGNMEELIAGAPSDVSFVDVLLDLTGVAFNGDYRLEDPSGQQYEVFRIRHQLPLSIITARAV